MIKLRISRWEVILGYLSGPSIITKVLTRVRQEGQRPKEAEGKKDM